MKKALILIIAVAILGALYIYDSENSSGKQARTNGITPSSQNSSSSKYNYRDGSYEGNAAETPYGVVHISAVISDGKILDIQFIEMPKSDEYSREVTSFSSPHLKQTAIDKQSAKSIDFVTGATATSYGFQESLQAALNKARAS